jgi:hypothetical protein
MKLAFLVAAVLAAAGCGRHKYASGLIGPSGGTVFSADGNLELDIPRGALDSPTAITIDPQPTPVGSGFQGASVYALEPEGLQFKRPVRITISYHPAELTTPEISLHIAKLVPADVSQFAADTRVDTARHRVSGTIAGFSTWGVTGDFSLSVPDVTLVTGYYLHQTATITARAASSLASPIELSFSGLPQGVTASAYAIGGLVDPSLQGTSTIAFEAPFYVAAVSNAVVTVTGTTSLGGHVSSVSTTTFHLPWCRPASRSASPT